jgi:hypothetical protein
LRGEKAQLDHHCESILASLERFPDGIGPDEETAKVVGLSRQTFRKHLRHLVAAGKVVRRPGLQGGYVVALEKYFRKNDERWVITFSIVRTIAGQMKEIARGSGDVQDKLIQGLLVWQGEFYHAVLEMMLLGVHKTTPTRREIELHRAVLNTLYHIADEFGKLLQISARDFEIGILKADEFRSAVQAFLLTNPEVDRVPAQRVIATPEDVEAFRRITDQKGLEYRQWLNDTPKVISRRLMAEVDKILQEEPTATLTAEQP